MYTLKHGTLSYEVDHAVKGADFVRGYDADGKVIVSFEGVTNFSSFLYSGTYLTPEKCAEESCNEVKHVNGSLIRSDGEQIFLPYLPSSGGNLTNHVTFDNGKGIACKDSDGKIKHVTFLSSTNILWIGYDMSNYPIKFGAPIVLTSEHYGEALPSAGIKGRIFFKKV